MHPRRCSRTCGRIPGLSSAREDGGSKVSPEQRRLLNVFMRERARERDLLVAVRLVMARCVFVWYACVLWQPFTRLSWRILWFAAHTHVLGLFPVSSTAQLEDEGRCRRV